MVRNIKLQIMWASVILITVLVLGFLGVYALQKSMTIKMTYTVNPNIRCEIFIGEDRIFSNLSTDSFISPNWIINEASSELIYRNPLTSSLGSSVNFTIFNHTTEHIFVETIVSGNTYDSKIIDAKTSTATSQNLTAVIPTSTSFAIKFTQVYKITPTFTNVEFDMNYAQNTVKHAQNGYCIPIGEDLEAKFVASTGYSQPTITSLICGTNNLTSTINTFFSAGILEVPYNLIDGNISLTANGVPNNYTITFDKQGGTNAGTSSIVATYASSTATIYEPARIGYIFGGYYTQPNGAGTCYYSRPATDSALKLYSDFKGSMAGWTINLGTETVSITANYLQITYSSTGFSQGIFHYGSYVNGNRYIQTIYAKQIGNVQNLAYSFSGRPPFALSTTSFTYTSIEGAWAYNNTEYIIADYPTAGTGFQIVYCDIREQQSIPLNRAWDIAGNTTLYAKWIAR